MKTARGFLRVPGRRQGMVRLLEDSSSDLSVGYKLSRRKGLCVMNSRFQNTLSSQTITSNNPNISVYNAHRRRYKCKLYRVTHESTGSHVDQVIVRP